MAKNSAMKAQSSMEYLAIYGWALLLMFFVLAFIVGSGIFNPNRFVAEECSFRPQLQCPSYYIYKSGSGPDPEVIVRFNLTNALGYPIIIRNYTVTMDKESHTFEASSTGALQVVQQGAQAEFTTAPFLPARRVVQNDVKKAVVTIEYVTCDQYKQCNAPSSIYDLAFISNGTYLVSGRILTTVRG